MKNEQIKQGVRFFALPLMLVQIGLGLWYFIGHFGSQVGFGETLWYLNAGTSHVFDEYTGVLYPVFLRAAYVVGFGVAPIFAGIVQGLQVLAFFGASYLFLSLFTRDTKTLVMLALFLTTEPALLQLHTAMLPYSFRISFALLLLYGLAQIVEHGIRKNYVLQVALVLLVVICGINVAFAKPGSRGWMKKTVTGCALHRLVWPHFGDNYFFWDADVQNVMSVEEAIQISRFENKVVENFGPKMEKTYGDKKAAQLYRSMIKACVTQRTKEVCIDILTDVKDYALLPLTEMRNLRGEGFSETGWNYKIWNDGDQPLDRLYWWYGRAVLLILAVLGLFFQGKRKGKEALAANLLFILSALTWLKLVLQDNMPIDGRKAAVIWLLWGFLGISIWLSKKGEPYEEK